MTSSRIKTIILTLVGILALGVALYTSGVLAPEPTATLNDLRQMGQLQSLFNREAGVPRLILLLSPT